MNRSEWATPQAFFDQVNAEFNFTLDACALPHNAKVARYFTPEQDGLRQEWSGTVWVNPPYGDGIEAWLEKAVQSAAAGATVVALVPTRTNPPWWHEWAMKAHEIRFVKSKLSFVVPGTVDEELGVPFTGHALLVYRPHVFHHPVVSSYAQPPKRRKAA